MNSRSIQPSDSDWPQFSRNTRLRVADRFLQALRICRSESDGHQIASRIPTMTRAVPLRSKLPPRRCRRVQELGTTNGTKTQVDTMGEELNGSPSRNRHEHAPDSARHATCPASGLIIAERALFKGRQDMLPSIFCSGLYGFVRARRIPSDWAHPIFLGLRKAKYRRLKAGPTLCSPPNVALKTNIGPTSSIGGFVALPPDQRKWDARHSRSGVAQGSAGHAAIDFLFRAIRICPSAPNSIRFARSASAESQAARFRSLPRLQVASRKSCLRDTS